MTIFAKIAATTGIALLATSAYAFEINFDGPLDVDGDGVLTQEEFAPIEALGASFIAYDSNGDGVLQEVEYNEGVRTLANEDGDGSLSPEEFQRVDELTRMFSMADADRDNLLDTTETGAITE